MPGLRVATVYELDPSRIKQARQWAGVSGRALSRELKMGYEERISKIENGKGGTVEPELIGDIAAALAGQGLLRNVSKDQLTEFFYGQIEMDDAVRPVPRLEAIAGIPPYRSKVVADTPSLNPSFQQQAA